MRIFLLKSSEHYDLRVSLPTLFPSSAVAVIIILLLLSFQFFWLIYLLYKSLKTNLYTLVSHYPIFQPRIVKSAIQSVYDLVDIRTPQSGHRGSHCRFCFHSQGSQDPGKQLKTKLMLRTFVELNLSPNTTRFYLYTEEE